MCEKCQKFKLDSVAFRHALNVHSTCMTALGHMGAVVVVVGDYAWLYNLLVGMYELRCVEADFVWMHYCVLT